MSSKALAKAARKLRESAAQAAWRQWGAIFSFPASDRPARAIVDPEALLLVSMALAEHEPRVWSAGPVWAHCGSRLLSVQRTKNLMKSFPSVIGPKLQEFAAIAVTRGNDRRWRSLATSDIRRRPTRRETLASPRLGSPAALMLRLRLGLGVGIKADVLALLVGAGGAASTVQQITTATRYYGRAVRRAVEELAAAGFVHARASAPASYRVALGAWSELLDIDPDDPPAWRPWAATYAFVSAVSEWVTHGLPTSETVAASQARDLVTAHREALDAFGVPELPPTRYPGAAFLEPFTGTLVECGEYLESVV